MSDRFRCPIKNMSYTQRTQSYPLFCYFLRVISPVLFTLIKQKFLKCPIEIYSYSLVKSREELVLGNWTKIRIGYFLLKDSFGW